MRKTVNYKVMKARGANKYILEHIAANVQGGGRNPPPPALLPLRTYAVPVLNPRPLHPQAKD